jgi:hypothetical protein
MSTLADFDDARIEAGLDDAVARAEAEARAASAKCEPRAHLRGTRNCNLWVTALKASTAKLYKSSGIAFAKECGYGGDTASIAKLLANTAASIEHLKTRPSDHPWKMSTLQAHTDRLLGVLKHCSGLNAAVSVDDINNRALQGPDICIKTTWLQWYHLTSVSRLQKSFRTA